MLKVSSKPADKYQVVFLDENGEVVGKAENIAGISPEEAVKRAQRSVRADKAVSAIAVTCWEDGCYTYFCVGENGEWGCA